jgi:hypothetical protein
MMKMKTRCLVLVLLAQVVAQVLPCTGNSRGSVDARPGVDAPSCVYGGTTHAPGETFSVGCRNCSCLPTGVVACSARLCLVDSGTAEPDGQDTSPQAGCVGADEACLHNGDKLAAGESGVDGCSTYCGKLTCTVGVCAAVDAGVPVECSLPTWLEFGLYGGLDGETRTILDTSGTLTVILSAGSCVSELPACGTACAITVATIAKDLADPDVQAAFAAGSGTPYGVSLVSVDVADFRITLGDGRGIRVGVPCCRFPDSPCQPIPKGVQRLVNDLQSLVTGNAGCP